MFDMYILISKNIPTFKLFNIRTPMLPITNMGFGKNVTDNIISASFFVISFFSSRELIYFALLGSPENSDNNIM